MTRPSIVALDSDEGSDAFAAIGVLVHREVGDFRGSLQGFGENRVGGINKRLDEFPFSYL